MKNKLVALVVTCGVIVSAHVAANGLNEDEPWKFESAVKKQYLLNTEQMRKFLDGGGYESTYHVTNHIAEQYNNNGTNYINSSVVEIDGNGNRVKVDQYASGNTQTNSATKIEGEWYLQADNGDFILCGAFCDKLDAETP